MTLLLIEPGPIQTNHTVKACKHTTQHDTTQHNTTQHKMRMQYNVKTAPVAAPDAVTKRQPVVLCETCIYEGGGGDGGGVKVKQDPARPPSRENHRHVRAGQRSFERRRGRGRGGGGGGGFGLEDKEEELTSRRQAES